MQPGTVYFNEVVKFPRLFGACSVFRAQRVWRCLRLLPRLRCLDMMIADTSFTQFGKVDTKSFACKKVGGSKETFAGFTEFCSKDQLTTVSCIVFAYSSLWISRSNNNICGIFSITVAWEDLCFFVMSFYHPFFVRCFGVSVWSLSRPLGSFCLPAGRLGCCDVNVSGASGPRAQGRPAGTPAPLPCRRDGGHSHWTTRGNTGPRALGRWSVIRDASLRSKKKMASFPRRIKLICQEI